MGEASEDAGEIWPGFLWYLVSQDTTRQKEAQHFDPFIKV